MGDRDSEEEPFPKVNFNWEMLLGKPDHRCFGMTGRRQLFPLDPIRAKFGAALSPIRGTPNLGPNSYNVDETTSIAYDSENMLTSTLGYSMGARTDVRIAPIICNQNPGPGHYFRDLERTFPQETAPFRTSSPRLPPIGVSNVPGPGTYTPMPAQVRGVELPQSLGGRARHIIQIDKKPSFKPLERDRKLERQRRRLEYLNIYW